MVDKVALIVWDGWTATCVGTNTPLQCPVYLLENHMITFCWNVIATSGITGY